MAQKKTTAKKAVKKVKEEKVKKEKVIKGDIIVHNPTNPTQEFVIASELADDEQIEAELMGKAMEHYVYAFDQQGKQVTGLTVAGVNEMSRQLTRKKDSGVKIRIVPDSIKIERNVEENGELGVSVILMAENMISGETAIGAKFEPFKKKGRNGAYDNTFALEKAVSKAERNAKRKLIPEKVAIEMIKKFVKTGGVQSLQAPVSKQISAPKKEEFVDYIKKLITLLAREAGVKITAETTKEEWQSLVVLYNDYTGQEIKSLRVAPNTAKKYLMDFLNCPLMINKK